MYFLSRLISACVVVLVFGASLNQVQAQGLPPVFVLNSLDDSVSVLDAVTWTDMVTRTVIAE